MGAVTVEGPGLERIPARKATHFRVEGGIDPLEVNIRGKNFFKPTENFCKKISDPTGISK